MRYVVPESTDSGNPQPFPRVGLNGSNKVLRNIFLVLSALAVGLSASAADWTIESVGPGARPDLAVGDDGIVHIAWAIQKRPDESVYCAQREMDSWQTEVALSGYFHNAVDLELDRDGRAHIAFHDHDSADAAHLSSTTTSWDIQYVFHPGHDGWNPSLAVAPDGAIHLASFDPGSGIEYAVIRGSTFDVETVGSGALDQAFGTSLALDDGDTPHLCFHDGDDSPAPDWDGSLYYAVRGSGGWDITVVDSGGDVGKFASLALDSQGQPHIAYLKREDSTAATVRYAYRNEGSWIIEDVLLLEDLGVDLLGAHRTVTLALDDQDRPHIAASDKTSVFYGVRRDAGWVVDTVIEQSSSDHTFGQLASLALDSDGRPHIAFFELSPGSTTIGTVYYASVAVRAEPRRPSGRVRPSPGLPRVIWAEERPEE